jgi:hypothetical protein
MNKRTLIFVTIILCCVTLHQLNAESGRQVNIEVKPRLGTYMAIMTKDIFFGGIAGGLIGRAIFLISGFEADPIVFAQASGIGMMCGTGFGVWEIADYRNQVRGPAHVGRNRKIQCVRFCFNF